MRALLVIWLIWGCSTHAANPTQPAKSAKPTIYDIHLAQHRLADPEPTPAQVAKWVDTYRNPQPYIPGQYVCHDFSKAAMDNLNALKYRACYTNVGFVPGSPYVGHSIITIFTTKGPQMFDVTGNTAPLICRIANGKLTTFNPNGTSRYAFPWQVTRLINITSPPPGTVVQDFTR